MTNFFFVSTIFSGFGFCSAENIPQNRGKSLFFGSRKIEKFSRKSSGVSKTDFSTRRQTVEKAPKTSNSPSSAYQGFFLCHPERSAKDPRSIDREKILRHFAPQNDKDGGFPKQFKISVRDPSRVILSEREGSSRYRQRKDSSSLCSSE